jgi:uncharacterized protein RhaS with RHS repeats
LSTIRPETCCGGEKERFVKYDPDAGRYINKDPIGLIGGLNQYGYTHNPINWVDPVGLDNVFRGDDFYTGGDMELPLDSEADVMTP